MLLQRILNLFEKQPGFVYAKATVVEDGGGFAIEQRLRPRKGCHPICSGCFKKAPALYDRLGERRFRYLPLLGSCISLYFVYALRRVHCKRCCAVKVEAVPWATGKSPTTISFEWFLADWAKRMSWSATASAFRTSWQTVRRSVQVAVEWGLKHRQLQGVTSIGVDEIAYQKGHKYLTLVYQIDEGCKRLLAVAKDRTEESLLTALDLLGAKVMGQIKFVASDMWKGYLNVVSELMPDALHVLDRFHIVKKLNEAMDQIRREEQRRLSQEGFESTLKHSRWCLLKRPENLTDKQTVKLRELLKYNLKSARGYLMKEEFDRYWSYKRPRWAKRFLEEWIDRAMRSRLDPMKKFARTLRAHDDLLENWFKARGEISSGAVEGNNRKAKMAMRNACGFRTFETAEVALYHQLGQLPTPNWTHRFS